MNDWEPPLTALMPADLTSCDREPIHVPGHIQPHGVLIATAPDSRQISHVSANFETLFAAEATAFLNTDLEFLVGANAYAMMEQALEQAPYAPANVLNVTMAVPMLSACQVQVHRHQGRLILELENAPDGTGADAMLTRAQHVMARLNQARTVTQLCDETVREVRRLTGYERVMMYRFDEAGHGTVIAEETAAGLEPYLNLRYPASDVPQQARRLYQQQRIHSIPDVHYRPVGLLGDSAAALDMSFCSLRGISPIHLEYLRNMGVRASFSISVLRGDRLWGLICCHHHLPLSPSPNLRALCDVEGQVVSALLRNADETGMLEARLGRQSTLARLRYNIKLARQLGDGLTLQPDAVLGLVDADGLMLRRGNDIRLLGRTPSAEAACTIVDALLQNDSESIRGIGDAGLPGGAAATEAATASGILMMPLPDHPGDVLVWFRPEVTQTVCWAGNPNKPLVQETDGIRLSPRKSFAIWSELVRGRSEPWSLGDLQAAEALRQILTETLLQKADEKLVRLAGELSAHAERQAEAHERENALFHNSADVLLILRVEQDATAPQFRYEAVSPALATVTGWQPHDLIGRRPEDCLPSDVVALLLPTYLASLQSNTSTTYAIELATPRGLRRVEGSLMPIREPATGRIIRLAGTMRDVTEQRRLEAAEHQSQKMEAIGRLAAGVAHDFNNILQSISGALETVQDDLPANSSARTLTSIGLRAAGRGASLTHHLLSYARKQMLIPQVVELPGILAEVQMLLARTLAPNIAVTVRSDPAARCVRVDPAQFQTALINLAINASHAMPDGGRLLIETGLVSSEGRHWITVGVVDNGCGMDGATMGRAVEPFFSTKGLNGTGLGLSMAQGFAEQSGGRLSIESAVGRGTTVTLLLPVPNDGTMAPEAGSAEAVSAARRQAAQQTVLLVDDDPDVLMSTGIFLEKAGFQVIQVAGAHQALRLLASGTVVRALITDYAMPDMNGDRLIAEVRLILPRLPAVMITGFTHQQTETWDADVIMLTKPFRTDALINALKGLLKPNRDSGAP
jgi:light-regulated signal transduction histidine kinase (bacteriophytochrome)/CheY-like chemotaxis protein